MLSIAMTLPIILLLSVDTTDWQAFVYAALLTLISGMLLAYFFKQDFNNLQTRQLFLITFTSWIGVSAFSSIPFILCDEYFTVTDAVFETVSGITTTGSTILTQLDQMPKDLLFWRSMLQWLGGIGIIAMAIAVLPFLHVGGMRLFKTESSDWSEKSHSRAKDASKALVTIYCTLTIACCLMYFVNGMPVFDAVNHAMTTIATGGYSTHDASIGHYQDSGIEWTAIIFMASGSLPFLVYVRFVTTRDIKVLFDQQVLGFIKIVCVISLLTGLIVMNTLELDLETAIRVAFLNITSVISTTGYASSDYNAWGSTAVVIFFFAMFIGGCSGSTSGGMKIFRFQLSYMLLKQQLIKTLHPRIVLTNYYNGKAVGDDITESAVAFTFLFFLTLAAATFLLALLGLDYITALSGALTALTNVGPGLGSQIGPAGNFSGLPELAKWVLAICMILGRLELLSIFAILSWYFWNY